MIGTRSLLCEVELVEIDEGALNRLLGKQRKYMDARDNAGWKKYLEIKQKFM